MIYLLLANLVLMFHLTFVIFVLFGGLLVRKWRWLAWLHLPAATWGAAVEFGGWVCPLTTFENWLRAQAGETGYQSGFVADYLLPILYPDNLTHDFQLMLGMIVVAFIISMYGWLLRRPKVPVRSTWER
ncbi:MAG TPA: DUF2784 domain-containing protein [Nitrospiraceae bacterium]|nr:DUF2784 domain-containing protein [Nitrospiraceae bacterium]